MNLCKSDEGVVPCVLTYFFCVSRFVGRRLMNVIKDIWHQTRNKSFKVFMRKVRRMCANMCLVWFVIVIVIW